MEYNDEAYQELNFESDRCVQINENIFQEPFEMSHCVLCTKSNLGDNGTSLIDELRKIDNELMGKASDAAIFQVMAKYYQETIRAPAQRHSPRLKTNSSDFQRPFCFTT